MSVEILFSAPNATAGTSLSQRIKLIPQLRVQGSHRPGAGLGRIAPVIYSLRTTWKPLKIIGKQWIPDGLQIEKTLRERIVLLLRGEYYYPGTRTIIRSFKMQQGNHVNHGRPAFLWVSYYK